VNNINNREINKTRNALDHIVNIVEQDVMNYYMTVYNCFSGTQENNRR